MTGPYCTWRTCRDPAVVIHRGQTDKPYTVDEGGACARHNQQVHDRCARAGPVTSRTIQPAHEPTPRNQDALF